MSRHTLDAGTHKLFLNSSAEIPPQQVDRIVKTVSYSILGTVFVLALITLTRHLLGV